MAGCLTDAIGQPWELLPVIDARGTPQPGCLEQQPALTQFGAPQMQDAWSPASCAVAGYELEVRQSPTEWNWIQRLTLYTILPPNAATKTPFPLASLAQTATACDALDACVMFTSDGYLIGAYRYATNITVMTELLEAEKRVGPWQWRTMHYCPGECCGTWVSTGYSTTPLAVAVAQSHTPASSAMGAFTEPSGGPGLIGLVDSSMERCAELRAGVVSSFSCPQRCRVACCAEADVQHLSAGMIPTAPMVSSKYFAQCSVGACSKSCGFPILQQVVAAQAQVSIVSVAGQAYLAHMSRGQAARAGPTPMCSCTPGAPVRCTVC